MFYEQFDREVKRQFHLVSCSSRGWRVTSPTMTRFEPSYLKFPPSTRVSDIRATDTPEKVTNLVLPGNLYARGLYPRSLPMRVTTCRMRGPPGELAPFLSYYGATIQTTSALCS